MTSAHEQRNREFWDADADDYQAAHGEQLERGVAERHVLGARARERNGDVRGPCVRCRVPELAPRLVERDDVGALPS